MINMIDNSHLWNLYVIPCAGGTNEDRLYHSIDVLFNITSQCRTNYKYQIFHNDIKSGIK